MATFVMQALGCEVSALNTVHFSNHTGYRHWRGTRSSASEIDTIYQGLKDNGLVDFDVLLSGYAPGADAVYAVGQIGKDLKARAKAKGSRFMWVLDPVMGDEGKLYVSEEVVPAYKSLIRDADLILPNQFEAEVLSNVKITSLATLESAIRALHSNYGVPHIIVTSIRLPLSSSSPSPSTSTHKPTLSVVGSSRRSDGTPRLFRIDVPDIDCFFSGTGDMFAALIVGRFREALLSSKPSSPSSSSAVAVEGVIGKGVDSGAVGILANHIGPSSSWQLLPPDEVTALDLPLARAVEKVLASMVKILEATKEERDREIEKEEREKEEKGIVGEEKGIVGEEKGIVGEEKEKVDGVVDEKETERRKYLRATKAAEVRVVRNARCLREVEVVYGARELES